MPFWVETKCQLYGKFGFSVQKQIYQSLGGTRQYDSKIWEAFCDKVGWSQGGEWLDLDYGNLTFSLDTHYMGYLPMVFGVGGGCGSVDLGLWTFSWGWGVFCDLLSRRDL